MWVSTSRGCPGNCYFCYNSKMWGMNGNPCVGFLNTEKTIELFKDVIENQKITEFNIADDNFVMFKKRCLEVCEFLAKKYNRKISFFTTTRADKIDEEILIALKKAGCNSIEFGSESGSQRMLNRLNKQMTVETQGNAINLCHKHKIFSWDSFMIGIPDETIEDLNLTKKFIKKYKPDKIMSYIFIPMPGTVIFDELIKRGILKKPTSLFEWANYNDANFTDIRCNASKIPDKILKKTYVEFLHYREYRTKIKKFFWWIKKGKITYALKKLLQEFQK